MNDATIIITAITWCLLTVVLEVNKLWFEISEEIFPGFCLAKHLDYDYVLVSSLQETPCQLDCQVWKIDTGEINQYSSENELSVRLPINQITKVNIGPTAQHVIII